MNQASVPETNWRSAIAQGVMIWMALIVGFVVIPTGHPLLVGIAASTPLGAPLLPVALFEGWEYAVFGIGIAVHGVTTSLVLSYI